MATSSIGLPKLTIPPVGKPVGDSVPATKGSPGPASSPSASPTGLSTRSSSSKGSPPPRSAKPEWAVLGDGATAAKRDATIISAHIKANVRGNVPNLGSKADDDEIDEWESDAPAGSPPASPTSSAAPGSALRSPRSAGSSEPPTPATANSSPANSPPASPTSSNASSSNSSSAGSGLSGTTQAGTTPPSPTSTKAPAGSQSPVVAQAVPTAAQDPAGGKSSGGGSTLGQKLRAVAAAVTGKAAGAGGTTPAGAGANTAKPVTALGNIVPSSVGAVGQALNPLSNSPKATAGSNLAQTAMPSLSGGLQQLDGKAQTAQMAALGGSVSDMAKVGSMNLTHDAGADAIAQTRMAAGTIETTIAQQNAVAEMKNAKDQSAIPAAAVKGLAEGAKSAAQLLGS